MLVALRVPPNPAEEEKAEGDAGHCSDCRACANPPYRCANAGTDRKPDAERKEPERSAVGKLHHLDC
jgi:hypothetical protein